MIYQGTGTTDRMKIDKYKAILKGLVIYGFTLRYAWIKYYDYLKQNMTGDSGADIRNIHILAKAYREVKLKLNVGQNS